MDTKNLSTVRQMFAQTVFTHKVQEVAAEFKEQRAKQYKWIDVAIAGCILILLALQAAHLDMPIFAYVGIGVTVGEIIFRIVQGAFEVEKQAMLHKNSALKFMALRDKYLLLITDIMSEKISHHEIVLLRNALQQEYQSICDLAPQTDSREYREAQKRLNGGVVEGEAFTWSDAEIDRFLTSELRLGKVAEQLPKTTFQ
jgi:SMODS and SLOG-associating 2TM effector domain family 4